jgi:Domain of unknown function (DUF4282)
MPDRSSHQGLPDEWDLGSHAARGPFSADGAADGYAAEPAGSHRARTGAGPTYSADAPGAPYLTGNTDPHGVRAESYGTARDEAPGARADVYGAGKTDAYAVRPGTYGAAPADPFGDADPFGSRNADPFGPAPTATFGAVTGEAATARPDAGFPMPAIGDPRPGQAADARSFLSALFDFGFTSFVTPKVVKVLYTLIVIGTVVSALIFTILAFKASVMFGFFTLVFGDPLFILIVLAIYRIFLEFFMVTFRVAEDVRALRERGDLP